MSVSLLQQIAGKAGKVVSAVGGQNTGTPIDRLGASLQSYGGNQSGQGFVLVPKAYADTKAAPLFTPDQLAASNAAHPVGSQYYSGSTAGAGTNGNIPSTATNNTTGYDQINQGVSNGNSQIDADYNQSMAMLDQAQSGLQGQADTANQTIDQQFGAAKNEIQNTQTTAENATNASQQTAETQGKTAIQQARDLFRQTQQNNQSQLSALGISSSSVQEALAEKLGVETARRIAGVTDSIDQVRQNTVNELGRIKTYYQGKIADISNQSAVQKANIQQALIQGLNNINNARGQAASDKANARANLLSQAQNAISSLAAQQQQFEQQLQAWAAQKSAALTPIVSDPTYLNTLASTANTLQQQFNPSGFQYLPQVSYDKNGNMTGQITPVKKATDPLAELYQQAGVSQ